MGGGPTISRFAARPSARGPRSFAVRGDGRSFAVRGGPGRNAALRSNRNARFSGSNTNFNPARNANSVRNANIRRNTIGRDAVRNALSSRAVAGALNNRAALRNPNARAQIAASAATAGWHDGHDRGGWWRHRHGGYGWVGPVFWPFAYYDLYDYALWGYAYDPLFWDYGYNDIYAGLFAPYGYDDLTAYLPAGAAGPRTTVGVASAAGGAQPSASDQLAQLCGEDSRDIAGLPIDRIQQAIEPNDAQRAALDDLANASLKAAQDIKAACPTRITLTAPGRLAAMQTRIEAMIAAVDTVQPALRKFYDLLNDEQRARLNAMAQDQRKGDAARNSSGSLAQSCGAAQTATDWPAAEIDARLHPTEVQRTSLKALQDATATAAATLKNCPAADPLTPPARLEAIRNRLDTMVQAVKTVRTALDDFYGKLSDEQKAQFEAIGPGKSAASEPSPSDRPTGERRHVRYRHHASVNGMIRRLMSMIR
jgi:LTXXQ motif family protein